MTERIDEIRKKRFQFLNALFEETNGSRVETVSVFELGNKLGFSREESDQISDFLSGEGLLEFVAFGGQASITHTGIVQIENALAKPKEETRYFPPVNYIHVENMSNSQIQQGTDNSTQVFNYSSEKLDAIVELTKSIKHQIDKLGLSQDKLDEVTADIKTIDSQINSPKPKPNIIKESLLSLKTILEGVAGNMIADILLKKMLGLL